MIVTRLAKNIPYIALLSAKRRMTSNRDPLPTCNTSLNARTLSSAPQAPDRVASEKPRVDVTFQFPLLYIAQEAVPFIHNLCFFFVQFCSCT